MMDLPEPYATHLPGLLAAALAEDLPDLTGTALFAEHDRTRAELIARQDGVVCGLPAFAAVFAWLDPTVEVGDLAADGAKVARGDRLATVAGRARALLAGERTALNFAARLSGVATAARRFVDAVAGTGCTVLDTRKTTPGWRRLEKHATRCGGATNHRMGLFDVAMVKDTHIAACGSIDQAVRWLRQQWGDSVSIIVECASLDDVRAAMALEVPHLLLDNMDLATLREAVALVDGRAKLEASGGVTLASVRAVAETGVDYVSAGAITHSAPAFDLSLKVRP